jgi:Flp pilus assembly protein CpaB
MRRGRTLIFVLLIIIIAAVVFYVAYNQFVKPPAVVVLPSVEVYIAGQNIPQGGLITPELLATIKVAPGDVVEVMYTIDEASSLVGRAAKFPLDQGVVITTSMVGDPSSAVPISGPSWASLIPSGMTAMSIPANRFSLSGYAINDGAHVNLNACFLFVDVDPAFQTITPDLTATLTGTGFGTVTTSDGSSSEGLPILSLGVSPSSSPQGKLELDPSLQQPYYLIPSEAQRPRMVCQMMLQDVVVMKMGNFSREEGATIDTPSVPPTTDANGQPVQTNPLPDIVTLIVTPQDSVTLTYLINAQTLTVKTNPDGSQVTVPGEPQTRFSLTLRNPTDQARQATEASTLQFLLSQYNIPIPAKLPYALQPALTGLLAPTETIVTP